MSRMPVNAPESLCVERVERAKKRLTAAVEKAGSERAFARQRDVNILFVSQLLRKGIEPTDKTEKGREIRVKLFLTKRKPKPGKPRRRYLPGERRARHIIAGMARRTAKEVFRKP